MTDAKITGGDLTPSSAGGWETVSGADAAYQRALLCLTVPQGSFIYDRELGRAATPCADAARAELLFSEALAKYDGVSVHVTGITDGVAQTEITIDGESRTEEVHCDGNL